MKDNSNNIIFYQDEQGKMNIPVLLENDDIWLTENQLADIYRTSRQNINLHINTIYKDNELSEKSTRKKILQVQKRSKDGK